MPQDISYPKAVLIAVDQLLNALFCGWPDETISSRAYRWDITGVRHWPRKLLDWIAAKLGDEDHCHESFVSESFGSQFPPEARLWKYSGL